MKNRITEEHIENLLRQSEHTVFVAHEKETLISYKLPCGFTITGRAACVDPANFDFAKGKQIAFEDARRQLWAFEGYRLQVELHSKGEL